MKILNLVEKGYKYRIYPNKAQSEQIETMFRAKRFVWNYFLNLNKEKLEKKENILTYNTMSSLLTLFKRENIWLKECEKSVLQNTLKDLYQTFQKFFKKECGFPKFKSYKNNYQSMKVSFTNNNIEVLEKEVEYTAKGKYKKQNCKIKIPKIKKIKIAYSRQYQGRIVSSTVSRDTDGKHYISLCCIEVEHSPEKQSNSAIGIDLGLKEFGYTSDKEIIPNPKLYRKYEEKLIRAQRNLSKRKKDSKNRERQRLKVNKWHKKIANSRYDFLQKLSTLLIKTYDIICLEDLSSSNMMKNHKLSKSIADASFFEFNRQLEYKARWNFKIISRIDRFYPSSKMCSNCGNISDQTKDLKIRVYKCEKCKLEIDRDYNASLNILNEGLRIIKN